MVWLAMISTVVTRSAIAAPRFGMTGAFQVDSSAVRVVAAEIDGQNGLDLVTGNDTGEDGPSLSILLNRGQGSFLPEIRQPLDPNRDLLHAIAAGDFDGNGVDDIAVAVDNLAVFPPQTVVLVFRNNGSGQLLGPDLYPADGFFPQCLEAEDVNNDGVLDLLVCHSNIETGNGILSVFLGRRVGAVGSGTFDGPIDFTVGTTPSKIAVGQVDTDGRPDVVVTDADQRKVFVLYGTGTATLLEPPVAVADIDAPSAVGLRVVAGDPFPEVLVASVASAQLFELVQTSARNFAPAIPVPVDQPSSGLALADFDGDGVTDLALLSLTGGQLGFWHGEENGDITFGETVMVDAAANSLAVADLNGDGLLDVATTSFVTDRVIVALNGADVPPTPGPGDPTFTPTPVRTVTFTATATPNYTPTPTPTIGTPTPTRTPAGPGDVNCDGHIDVGDLTTIIARIFDHTSGCLDGEATAADVPFVVEQIFVLP